MDLEQRIAQLSPTKLALLEEKLKRGRPEAGPGSRPSTAGRLKHAPLSFAQERLWFLEQLEPDSGLYNLPAMFPLRGRVEPALVEVTVRQIVARHGAMRTRFVVTDGSPYQIVGSDAGDALDFSIIDLRDADPRAGAAVLSRALDDEIWRPFNLATGPLVRVRLVLQRGDENLLLLVMHHIISDGWSINLFAEEFRTLFESAHTRRPVDLPTPLQYVNYAIDQRQQLQGDKLQALLAYWRTQLEGAPSVIALPLDHPRPSRQSFRGALHRFTIPRASVLGLSSLCRDCGVVPFMVLLSAFKVLLFRYTNQSRIVVGTPIANRNRSELERAIGFFTNTLVLCSTVGPDMTFRELLAQVRDTTLAAYEHQDLPFEKLVSEVQPERSLSQNPLFQVMFSFQNLPTGRSKVAEPARRDEPPAAAPELEFRFSKFDLTLAMTETADGLSAVLEYATDLFEAATIQRMADHLANLLRHVLAHPDDQLAGFCFLPERERTLILDDWNETTRIWPEVLPLHARFERVAREMPRAPAVIYRGAVLTYGELDRRANLIARLLRSQGVDRGAIVGICLPRSAEMVIGLFAILKAGAAYMPIEPDYPEDRIRYMLKDASVSHVLTTSACSSMVSAHAVTAVALDDRAGAAGDGSAPEVPLGPADIAYVIFTSGSTGQPKGVMISHGAIDNRLQWMQEEYHLTPVDRVMQKTPYTFDVSVWEFFWPLAVGATLVVAEPERHKESGYLVELINQEQVTCMHFVPSMLQLFLHEDLTSCKSLRRIICSGEALTVEQCRRLQGLPGVTAHNLYGPTEAAVDVTYWDCAGWRDQYTSVPIGRPIANTQIYILNEKLQPVPIGVAGELHIGGDNLAKGYLNKPDLTAERFIASPFAGDGDARLYKTGDLARFRSDGNIEYIGRIDTQVKLRGLRIELGEVESVLGELPGIAGAAVVVHCFGTFDDRLAAYVVPDDPGAELDTDAISAALATKLPSYMVPSAIMVIPELPRTANGKLDRKRLPEPRAKRVAEPMAPVNDIEHTLLGIWRRVLKTEAVGTNDDFFALGGHSILVTQVINSVNGHYHLDVPVRLLFENPTIKALAKALSEFEDDAWRGDSNMAAMLMRADRRLLHALDQLSEDQLDEILRQHADDPRIAGFEDVKSLLAWAEAYRNAGAATPVTTPVTTSVIDGTVESPSAIYARCYVDLARTRAALQHLRAGTSGPPFASPPTAADTAAVLREQGSRIFESYAHAIKQRFSAAGTGALTQAELTECCNQVMAMCQLAASFGSS